MQGKYEPDTSYRGREEPMYQSKSSEGFAKPSSMSIIKQIAEQTEMLSLLTDDITTLETYIQQILVPEMAINTQSQVTTFGELLPLNMHQSALSVSITQNTQKITSLKEKISSIISRVNL